MKKIALLLVLTGLAAPILAQLTPSFALKPEDIRAGYIETLQEKLLAEVLADNFGAAKVIAQEIQRVTSLEVTVSNLAPCGTWRWVGTTMTTIYPGGRVVGNAGNATWKWTDEKQRKFQIKWESGWVDDCTLSADALSMHCKNNIDDEFTFHRVLPPEFEKKEGEKENKAKPKQDERETN